MAARFYLRTALLATAALASACTNIYNAQPSNRGQPMPDRDYGKGTVQQPAEPSGTSGQQTQPEVSRPQVIMPGEVDSQKARLAIDGLLQEGWDLFYQGNYDASIAKAERGLRINRQSAELFLLLAENYRALGMWGQAEQMAVKGLAITGAPSDTRRRLQVLLDDVRSGY